MSAETVVDAIVIGAGHNGLAAAVELASQGWKVQVVEAKSSAGGAVSTQELTLPGFRHDVCAMNLSSFAGSAFYQRHKEALTRHGLAFVPAEHCFASIFRDHTYLGVSTDLETTLTRIRAISDKDAVVWQAMLDDFQRKAPHLFAVLGSPMPSWSLLKGAWKSWRELGKDGVAELLQLLLATPRDFLDRHFESDSLKAMMAAWGLHVDFTPDTAGGALFPYLESMANQAFGMVIGQGGADTIIRAMTGLLQELGGELLLNAPVQTIEQENGRATGVVLTDGRRLKARKAVIANLNPQLVFGRLVQSPAVPSDYQKKVDAFRPGLGTMMIHLAMDGLPDWKAGADLQRFSYVHLAPDMAMMSRVYAEAAAGLLPAEPVLVVGQGTALDSSRAPEGKHTLWVQVRVLPAQVKGDALGQITAGDWSQLKDAYAERVLDLLESYAPGLRSMILARHIMSPQDLEQFNANLIGGDNLSGSHHLDQNFFFRPVAGYSKYKTPIKDLYLCGASTWPGAGTGAGSGYMLANILAK